MHPYVNASHLDFRPGSRIKFKLLPLTERLPLTVNTFKQTICFTHTGPAQNVLLRMTHKVACLVQFKETLEWIDVLFSVNKPKKQLRHILIESFHTAKKKPNNFSVKTSQYFTFKLCSQAVITENQRTHRFGE